MITKKPARAKPSSRRNAGGARVIQFPASERSIDVRKLLIDGQSTPTVLIPAELQKAIDKRARELSEEAYALCREHLQRRVAFTCEYGYPRVLDLAGAYKAIAQGNLGGALANAWITEMKYVVRAAKSAARQSAEFEEKLCAALEESGWTG
jgi:hypothetical protein